MSSQSRTGFYQDGANENSVRFTRCLFEDLVGTNRVYSEYELDSNEMVTLHNHMNSSSTWRSITQWDSGIQYNIHHPGGDITINDKNRGQNTEMFRRSVIETFNGMTHDRGVRFRIYKTDHVPVDINLTSCHASRYTWVRIESKKTFEYVSERASWDFSLSVVWEGGTKEEAESSDKKYVVTISMASMEKASKDPGYTTASFMEKLMDTLFQRSPARRIVFVDDV